MTPLHHFHSYCYKNTIINYLTSQNVDSNVPILHKVPCKGWGGRYGEDDLRAITANLLIIKNDFNSGWIINLEIGSAHSQPRGFTLRPLVTPTSPDSSEILPSPTAPAPLAPQKNHQYVKNSLNSTKLANCNSIPMNSFKAFHQNSWGRRKKSRQIVLRSWREAVRIVRWGWRPYKKS